MSENNTLKVYDTSATSDCPVRNHEMVFGGEIERFQFKVGEGLVLPIEKALRFNKPGFIVKSMDDTIFEKPVVADNVTQSRLAPGEIVARLEELTTEALRLRAAVLPNGETTTKLKKEELIEFIKAASGVVAKPAVQASGEASDGDLESEDGIAGGTIEENTAGQQGPTTGGAAFTE